MRDQLLDDLHFIDDTKSDALRKGFEAGVKAAAAFFADAQPLRVDWTPVPATLTSPAAVRPVIRYADSGHRMGEPLGYGGEPCGDLDGDDA